MEPAIEYLPVDQSSWPDLERFFEARGSPHYCWCMAWLDMPSKPRGDTTLKKAALKAQIDMGTPVGILAKIDDTPIAWCSIGPRSSFRRLTDEAASDRDERIWSIVCFFVQRRFRSIGITGKLIDEAVSYAQLNGAEIVEAYPVDRDAPSYRFMGFVDRFERAGFIETGMAGGRRHIMQLPLHRPKPAVGDDAII